jgi:hypothetical protein
MRVYERRQNEEEAEDTAWPVAGQKNAAYLVHIYDMRISYIYIYFVAGQTNANMGMCISLIRKYAYIRVDLARG